jgi:hypothetical protein
MRRTQPAWLLIGLIAADAALRWLQMSVVVVTGLGVPYALLCQLWPPSTTEDVINALFWVLRMAPTKQAWLAFLLFDWAVIGSVTGHWRRAERIRKQALWRNKLRR